MGNIRVENCCCLSLQTGVIILGAFDLITGILTVANGGRYVAGDPLVGSDFIVEGGELIFLILILIMMREFEYTLHTYLFSIEYHLIYVLSTDMNSV